MASQQKRRGKARAPIEVDTGLLDAYVVGAGSSDHSSKPVSKKNKNQKKREQWEAEQKRKEEEDKKKEVVVDSWEEIADDSSDPALQVVEQELKKLTLDEVVPKEKEECKVPDVTPKVDGITSALEELQRTIGNITVIFEQKIEEPKKEVKMDSTEGPKTEKSKEEIKAEREAKKKAKAEAKSGKGQQDKKSEVKPEGADEKSREEVKAEREAKKAAKQAKKKGDQPANSQVPTKNSEAPATEGGQKSKAELKAERRAKQEAQRAAKAAAQQGQKAGGAAPKAEEQPSAPAAPSQSKPRVPDDIQADRASVEKKLQKKLASAHIPARTKAQRKVMLFSHLHQYERELSISRNLPVVGGNIHPAVVQLGLQYAEGTISGSNARCVALLNTMKQVIRDYETPPQKEMSRDLDARIKPYLTFLKQCRPLSVSMGNAVRFLKSKITTLDPKMADEDAKTSLIEAIDEFVLHNIELAAKQIALTANLKIRDGDVILTYGCSSLLKSVFAEAHQSGKKFRVIVADGRPRFEGREMVRRLVNLGISCSYILVSSVSYIINEVSKVILGAHAVLANGCVMSRVGTSQVALIAKASNVPVLVCCETYKFSERVQTDSFVFNELGDPDDLINTGRNYNPLEDWRDLGSLCLLNLNYDFTPADLVDAIISEISVIPGTSVPVVLRLKNADLQA